MNDSFVAGAVERNRRVCVASALGEVVFGAFQVTDAFFTRRRDELDRASRTYARAVDLRCQREHDGDAATVVVDSRANEAVAVTANGEIGLAREDGVEMRADDDWLEIDRTRTTTDDVARVVGVNRIQAAVAKATTRSEERRV